MRRILRRIAIIFVVVLLVPIFYMMAMMGATYYATNQSIHVLIAKRFGVNKYDIKESTIKDYLFNPGGSWWVKLEDGFDTRQLEHSNLKFFEPEYLREGYDDDKIGKSKVVDEYIVRYYGYPAHGFRVYQSEDEILGEGLVLCNKKNLCYIRVYAKDGDKNLFVDIDG